jgi:predicted RNase H-like HicB family nuclease
MWLNIETELEIDGRWLADIPTLPGVMAYGKTQEQAVLKVQTLALRVLADRLEQGLEPVEGMPYLNTLFARAGL